MISKVLPISADSHLEIPSDRWISRVPSKYRDRAPRLIKLLNGGDAWIVEGRPMDINGLNLSAGRKRDQIDPLYGRYDNTPGTGSPEQRLQEQDQDGIQGEILFTGVSGPDLWRGIKDDSAYRSVVRAYNDFLGEEYCPTAPNRLIGLGVIPETSIQDAIDEMSHCKNLGLKGVTLNAFPGGKSHPTAEDDEFWAAAVALDMPISVHVQFGFPANTYGGSAGPAFNYQIVPPEGLVGGLDIILRYNKFGSRGSLHACQLIWAGVFDRFPSFKIFFAETQVGWIPNFLEMMDNHYVRNYKWAERHLGMSPLRQLPSEYIKEHCYWGFIHNPVGVRAMHREIGVDRIMWSTDFPHMETTWPDSSAAIDDNFAGIPDSDRYKMTNSNCEEFFKINVAAAD
jgi:predicted TIM-barrel fold metal-dependent hydrolase